MRKLLVLPIILTAIIADFSAFCATARGGRSIANATNSATNTANTTNTTNAATNTAQQQTTANAPVAARAARNRAKAPATNGAAVSARAATRTSVARSAKSVAAPKIQQPTTQQQSGKPGVAARAAKKAVNMGTAIKTAAENTVMPKECQDAYYGCMDAFCMVENMSGGRCRCDDRSEELDKVLDAIMKVDEQSKILAEDGLERLQRGMLVDEINAMAADAAQKVREEQKGNKKLFDEKGTSTKKKAKTDYSSQLSSLFSQSNVFDTGNFADDGNGGALAVLGTDMSDKTGHALKNAAASMCLNKMPTQCREYSEMLQLGYSNQIGNDCRAYENDLKQRKMNSENLLRTAQKTLRDAAAEAYENANKYDLGGCVVEYRKCMIGEDACGAGFSKCVVNKAVLSEKASTTPIDTGVATIEVELTTLNEVTAKKIHCESVLDQCQKVKDRVWDEFLKSVAAELKSAEFAAEDDQRRNCAKNIVSCIREAAQGEGYKEGTDSWAIYTGNFKNFQETCKIQIDQCKSYSGALSSGIENYVKSALDALRADRCTTAIKKCLESENACHEDYSNCVGVGMQKIWNMCADIVKPDCEGEEKVTVDGVTDMTKLKAYVSQVAAGVMQNMDDKWAEYCKKTLESVMSDACGSTDSCPMGQTIPDTLISEEVFELAICPIDHADNSIDNTTCVKSANVLTKDQAFGKKVVYINRLGWNGRGTGAIQLDGTTFKFTANTNTELGNRIAKMLQDSYKIKYNEIINNETLKKCTKGSGAKDFDNKELKGSDSRTFGNLTTNIDKIIARGIYNAFNSQVSTIQETFLNRVAEETATLTSLISTSKSDKEAKCKEFGKPFETASTESIRYTRIVPRLVDDGAGGLKCRVAYTREKCEEYDDDDKCTKWVLDCNGEKKEECTSAYSIQ